MITVANITKSYGKKVAVDNLSFTVEPGVVTGFLGPNGAGKSTTMRMIVGLDRPDSGTVTVMGRPYADHVAPLHQVGALLEARAIHPGRSAYNHLLTLAATTGIPRRRVDEVLSLVGLSSVAGKRAGAFSLGMGQRLGIAAALLGDPEVVMLDEPVNGLDPEGIQWIRGLLKSLADEGRTVFISSHLISEIALVAEHLIVVGKGKLIADTTVAEMQRAASGLVVKVRSPKAAELTDLLLDDDVAVESGPAGGELTITGLEAAAIGDRALAAGLPIHALIPIEVSLEQAFMQMTHDAVEYQQAPATDHLEASR
ncbi:ABC-2 type transport system ATP-binding protein [Kribbella aluminosa]|uniref:ABC-2 type transport system ATP-binding protein n=1 Tax=Kribbella aluminosa TaxID=416017 RepID=A0ABS4UJE4_9ACTN|nr:ABC transporter ATP-binding protein [Kribbella aluminosa]MBP2351654.1 ABC-2 type transport system ATP-binding protein [Kribbella aluminosa]